MKRPHGDDPILPTSSSLLAVLWILTSAASAAAQCTSMRDAAALERSLGQASRCVETRLRHGPAATCGPARPPACATDSVVGALGLAYGGNDAPTSAADLRHLRSQWRCQREIGKAVRTYLGRRLRAALRHMPPTRADAKASAGLDRMAARCAVPVAGDAGGVLLPAVGPQCASAVGTAGSMVRTQPLRDCLHGVLDVWAERLDPGTQALRPNIVLIVVDDQRWDTIDGTHAPVGEVVMPGVEHELGDSGVRFRNAFVTTPLCAPSRASLLRGRYAHATNVHSNDTPDGGVERFDDRITLGTVLQGAGYRTGFYGKYLNGYETTHHPGAPLVPPGWNEWHAFREPPSYYDFTLVRNGAGFDHALQTFGAAPADYSTDVLRDLATRFIRSSVASGKPFFVYVAPKAPHLPALPAPRHAGMYEGLPPWRPASWNQHDLTDLPLWVVETPPLDVRGQMALDAVRRRQLESLQAVDELVAGSPAHGVTGIMQTLRDLGVDADTMVVYVSDNGWFWGEHGFDEKNAPYEEAIRIPMYVRYPKLAPRPHEETALALTIDLLATFADLAGVRHATGGDGLSLRQVLAGSAPAWRTDFLTEGWPLGREWAAVHEAQWVYIETVNSTLPDSPIEVELYDLAADPLQQQNVVQLPGNAPRMTRMAARLRVLRPAWPVDAAGAPVTSEE